MPRMNRTTRDKRDKKKTDRKHASDAPRRFSRRVEGVRYINPSDYEMLRRFVTEHGKIMPSRLTGLTAKQQRQVQRAVKRARVIGLLP